MQNVWDLFPRLMLMHMKGGGEFSEWKRQKQGQIGVFHFKDNNKLWVHISCHHTHKAPTSEMKNLCIFGQPLKISSLLKAWDKEMLYISKKNKSPNSIWSDTRETRLENPRNQHFLKYIRQLCVVPLGTKVDILILPHGCEFWWIF